MCFLWCLDISLKLQSYWHMNMLKNALNPIKLSFIFSSQRIVPMWKCHITLWGASWSWWTPVRSSASWQASMHNQETQWPASCLSPQALSRGQLTCYSDPPDSISLTQSPNSTHSEALTLLSLPFHSDLLCSPDFLWICGKPTHST